MAPVPDRRLDAWITALKRADYLIPAAGCAVLLLSCALVSLGKAMWVDEVFSHVHITMTSPIAMLLAIIDATEAAPPLYHLLGWLWVRAVDDSQLALRLFTSLAMSATLVVHYRTLRRAWGVLPAALATLAAFVASGLVLYQNAEARFYGLFALFAVLAIELAAAAAEDERPGRRRLVFTTTVHAALVMIHVFGAIYSAAILSAILLRDWQRRARRTALWTSIALGWLPLVIWMPALINHVDLGRPESWVALPSLEKLGWLYAFDHEHWPALLSVMLLLAGWDAAVRARGADPRGARRQRTLAVVTAVAVIALLALRMLWFVTQWWGSPTWPGVDILRGAAGHAAAATYSPILGALLFAAALLVLCASRLGAARCESPKLVASAAARPWWQFARSMRGERGPAPEGGRARRREQLQIIAGVLLIVPFLVYALSHIGPSIFVGRYMLPTLFAWSILGAGLLGGVGRGRIPVHAAWMRNATWGGVVLLAGWLLAYPLTFAANYQVSRPPMVDIAPLNTAGLPIATDDMFLFLPGHHYLDAAAASRLWLLLDSALVFDAPRQRGATTAFKLMQAWRRNALVSRIVDAPSFLCTTGRFLFIEDRFPRSRVLERRIVPDTAWSVRLIQQRTEFLLYDIERRRNSAPPHGCSQT